MFKSHTKLTGAKSLIPNLIFVLLSFALLVCFIVRTYSAFGTHSPSLPRGEAIQMESGEIIRQDIHPKQTLKSISIAFGTNLRVNEGTVCVALYDNDTLVQQWEINSADLVDNAYHEFILDNYYRIEKEHDLYFTIQNNFEGNNNVAVFEANTNTDDSICYITNSVNPTLRNAMIIVGICVFIAILAVLLSPLDEKVVMVLIVTALGISYFIACPLGMVPDENTHFLRAYEISHGSLLSQHTGETGEGGNELPSRIMDYEDSEATIDWSITGVFTYGNASLYAPISYLPQATGMAVAEQLVTNNVQNVLYAGRLFSFVTCMLLSIASLWIIPYGRKVIFMVILFPMTLQEMISVSPDGFTIALSLFLFSYIMSISYGKRNLMKRDYWILTLTCITLALCKIVYVVLLFLVLLIPASKFKSRKHSVVFKSLVILSAILLNLVWLAISAGYMVEFQPGVNSAEQVVFILTNIPNYLSIVIDTTITNGAFYVGTMFSSRMGALTIITPDILWIVLLILFVYEIMNDKERPETIHKQDNYVLLLVFLACVALIYTSLYVQWTPLKNGIINGIQGRYFIPIIALPAFAAINRVTKPEKLNSKGRFDYVILLTINGMVLLDIIGFYYAG